MSDRTEELAALIRAEADIASRAGQSDRLNAIADRVAGFEAMRWPEEAHRLQQQRNALLRVVARVEALADAMDDAGHEVLEGYDVAERIRAALAEPERDEEGGND